MGDGIVNQTFTANVTDLENKLAQAERAQLRLTDQLKKTRQESKEGHNEILHSLQEQGQEVTGMVTKYFTLGAAVEIAIKSYEKWIERLEKLHEEHNAFQDDLIGGMANIGRIQQFPAMQKWIEEKAAKGGAGTREQLSAAVQGVSAAAPTAAMDRVQAIALETAKNATAFGRQPGEVQKEAALSGRLAEAFPQKTPEEIANIADFLKEKTGADVEQITGRRQLKAMRSLTEAGIAPEKIFALQATMIKNQMEARAVGGIVDQINADRDIISHHGRHLTEKEVNKNRFAQASKSERLRMLMEDSKMQAAILGDVKEGSLETLKPADVAAAEAELTARQKTNALAGKIKAVAATEPGKEATTRQQLGEVESGAKVAGVKSFEVRLTELHEHEDKLLQAQQDREGTGFLARTWQWLGREDKKIRQRLFGISGVDEQGAVADTTNEEVLGFGEKRVHRRIEENKRANDQSFTSAEHLEELKKLNENSEKHGSAVLTNQATNAAQAARVNGRE